MADVVVSGLGCVAAAGRSVAAVAEAALRGQRVPRSPTRFTVDLDRELPVFEIDGELIAETTELAADLGVELEDDPSGWYRTSRLSFVAAAEALAQAGFDRAALRDLRVGVAIGSSVGCTLNDEGFYRDWRAGRRPAATPPLRYSANNPALLLARTLGVSGPVATVANACSSGADAVGLGAAWLAAGRCDAVIAGGSDELSRITCLGFASLMIASRLACRPFDRHRDGLNLGEGAGAMVLETAAGRKARGAPPALARVLGYSTYSDAYHATAPHPEGRGLRRAIAAALEQAGARPGDVGFVNAHGTSTPDNDRVEGSVLADLLPAGTPVVSTKAYTGHTLGAAGAIEAVLTVRSLLDGRLPATAGFATPDPECGLVPTTAVTAVDARIALSNSLAFGGNNSVLALGRV